MNMEIKSTEIENNVDTGEAKILQEEEQTPVVQQAPILPPTNELEEGMVPEIPTTYNKPQSKDKRFNEIYYKAKEFERIKPGFDQMKQELEELKSKFSAVNVSNINSEIQQIQGKYQEALSNGDFVNATTLNTRLTELMVDKRRAEEKKINVSSYEEKPQSPIVDNFSQQYNQPYIPPEAVVAVQIFEQNNPWYGTDEAMTAAMDVFAKSIKEDPEWSEKSFSSQLNAALKKVKISFPSKFKQAVPPSAVGGVVPVNPASNRTAIVLSPEEEAFVATLNPANPKLAREEYILSKTHYGGKV